MKINDVYLPATGPALTGFMLNRSLPDYPFPQAVLSARGSALTALWLYLNRVLLH